MSRYINSSDESIREFVCQCIEQKREDRIWDFKREWHKNNAELLFDILCMANNPEDTDSFLIIGVDEENNYSIASSIEDLGARKDTQQITNMLANRSWADCFPTIRVVSFAWEEGFIDVVIISSENAPYFLNKDVCEEGKRVRAGVIYSRNNDSNVAKDSTANPLIIERLWRKRFGIDKPPLNRLLKLLEEPKKWIATESMNPEEATACHYAYFHEDFPEFTYTRTKEQYNDGLVYFMFSSPYFDGPDWWRAKFYYHQTILATFTGSYSDNLWIPSPRPASLNKFNYVENKREIIHYRYYLRDSLQMRLIEFQLTESCAGREVEAEYNNLFKIIPIFLGEDERKDFSDWVSNQVVDIIVHKEKYPIHISILNKEKYDQKVLESQMKLAEESSVVVGLLKEYRQMNH